MIRMIENVEGGNRMDATLKNAYTEVSQILELLGEEYQTQIPEKLLTFFNEKQNFNYKTNISKDTPIDKIEVSRTALIIISILNLKYWETDEVKKEELKRIYDENERKFQEKVNLYKQNDWLKNDMIQEDGEQIKSLVVQKDVSWIEKIRKFFRNLVHFNRK